MIFDLAIFSRRSYSSTSTDVGLCSCIILLHVGNCTSYRAVNVCTAIFPRFIILRLRVHPLTNCITFSRSESCSNHALVYVFLKPILQPVLCFLLHQRILLHLEKISIWYEFICFVLFATLPRSKCLHLSSVFLSNTFLRQFNSSLYPIIVYLDRAITSLDTSSLHHIILIIISNTMIK